MKPPIPKPPVELPPGSTFELPPWSTLVLPAVDPGLLVPLVPVGAPVDPALVEGVPTEPPVPPPPSLSLLPPHAMKNAKLIRRRGIVESYCFMCKPLDRSL